MNISALRDLYQITVDRHDDLKSLLHDTDLSGEALRNEIADFFFSFQGIKDCSTHTAAAATMLHASLASEGFNLHIRQSLIAGIGLNCTDKEKIAGLAASTGRLNPHQLPYSQLESLKNEEWTGLLSIAVAVLCLTLTKNKLSRQQDSFCTIPNYRTSRNHQKLWRGYSSSTRRKVVELPLFTPGGEVISPDSEEGGVNYS
jgi:hypothetical protein